MMKNVRKKTQPVKRKRDRKKKEIYRLKNWSSYNASLKARGSLTVWFSQEAIDAWHYSGPQQRGGQVVYTDLAIQTALTFRSIYHLPLRQTEGFVGSIIEIMGLDLLAPDYSTISRRPCDLSIDLGGALSSEPLHVAIDSTGLKVYGEGEWLVRKHGWRKHRRWLKVHLAVDANSGSILACEVTTNSVSDGDAVPDLIEQIKEPVDTLSADGLYDVWKVYDYLKDPPFQDRPIKPVIPPKKNAKIKQHGNSKEKPLERDQAIRNIRKVGRKTWKQQTDYHKRSLSETAMFRYKTIIGDHVKARSLEHQITETRLGCNILNRMNELGKPDAYKVSIVN